MYIQALKFGLVGLANTATDFLVFSVCIYFLSFHILPANIAAFLVAVVQSYFVNRAWTFKAAEKRGSGVHQIIKFVLIQASALLISSAVVLTAANYLHWSLSKLISIFFTFVWSFVLVKYFVFPEKREKLS